MCGSEGERVLRCRGRAGNAIGKRRSGVRGSKRRVIRRVTRGKQGQRLIQIHTKPIHVKRDVIEVQRVELHFETKIAVPSLILRCPP